MALISFLMRTTAEDIEKLYNIWSRYHDDLGCPQYDEKPTFTPEESG